MKKVLSIIFILFLLLFCYIVYNSNKNNQLLISSIGDNLSNNMYLEKINNVEYNNIFIDKDYKITDIRNILEYNEEKKYQNKSLTIHNLLKKSDIVILSIGSNDLFITTNNSSINPYKDINKLINEYNQILKKISHYNYKKVIIIGYYTYNTSENDIYVYTNYLLEKLVSKYNYTFINPNKILKKDPIYVKNNNQTHLNNKGYYELFKIIVENIPKN